MATSPETPKTQAPLADLVSTARFLFGGLVWGAVMLITLGFWLRAKYPANQAMWANLVLVAGVLAAGLALWQAFTLWIQKTSDDQKATTLGQQQRLFSLIFMGAGLALIVLAVFLGIGRRPGGGTGFVIDNLAESLGVLIFGLVTLGGGYALSAPSSQSAPLIQNLTRAIPMLKLVVLVLGLAALTTLFWLFYRVAATSRLNYAPEISFLVFFSGLCIACFFWLNTGTFDEFGTRLFVLIFGGTAGLILFIHTLARAYLWRQDIFLGGSEAWQGENAWRFWVCAYVLFVSLVLIFASLNVARADVRSNVTLRRVLYGYDALAQAFLLIGILFVLNVVIYARFPLSFDWTKTRGAYDLSPSSKLLLSKLKQETNIYVLMSQNDPNDFGTYKETRNLLDNCQAISNNKLKVKYLAPDIEQREYRDLTRKFPQIFGEKGTGGGRGVLIVYGPEPKSEDHKIPHVFVAQRRLAGFDEEDPRRIKKLYKGESEIIKELKFLAQDQKKRKIYVLQGHDELNIANEFPMPRRDVRDSFANVGIGIWAKQLEKENYEVQGLSFELPGKKDSPKMVFAKEEGAAKTKEVPEDCYTLVIAGASRTLPTEVLAAIERYMDKGPKSKLIVFLDAVVDRDYSKFKESGLEPLLKRFGVEVTNEFPLRVPRLENDDPSVLVATPSEQTENPLARQFSDPIYVKHTARVLKPIDMPGRFKVETIWAFDPDIAPRILPPGLLVLEKDLRVLNDTIKYVRDLREDPRKFTAVRAPEPIPFALAVSEGKATKGKSEGDEKPRLIVFGDADFIGNYELTRSGTRSINYALSLSALEWIAEREAIGSPPKVTSLYTLPPGVNLDRMVFLPGFLMLLVLVGVGAGIWIARRR